MKPATLRPLLLRPAIQLRICHSRRYAVQAPGSPTLQVFNRDTKYLQKERAAANVQRSRQVDYLKDEVAMRLSERLLFINRHFDNVLDLGANSCNIARALTIPESYPDPTKDAISASSRISKLTAADSSRAMLYRDVDLPYNKEINLTREVLDNEERIPFKANTFDAVLSSLSMHWINDLPSLLAQINHILKPDCPFVAAMFGGDTLYELRTSLQLADQERRGGVSPHVSPLADVRDMGGLLQKAGFKMLTVDVDDIIVDFPDSFALMQDLQAMGESNAILGREAGPIKRDVLLANEAIYRELHGNEDGSLPATFRMIYMIGWKEGPHQSQPLPRGSGQLNIKDILGGGEFK
ncbi:methyltransferase domain-containing protein [Diplocarpon rosae]|nr:methyltransferase domain-containing protein [Diplocarpon rosae]